MMAIRNKQGRPAAGHRRGRDRGSSRQQTAESRYRDFLRHFASASLANYVNAVVVHILPIMQSKENLYRITRERIEDAAADGIVAMELRFAPQLHTWNGASMEEVMNSVIKAVKHSPIPVKLILCALRHG